MIRKQIKKKCLTWEKWTIRQSTVPKMTTC